MIKDDAAETFAPVSRAAWRKWLKQNHQSKKSVWLLLYKKEAGKPTISWGEAVEEALCFGWIDSKRKPIDHEKFIQFFSKRKTSGTWSKVNKEKILHLVEAGRMAQAGHDIIEAAKQNGSWNILDEVEELHIPKDLLSAFKHQPGSRAFFQSLSRSVRKAMLQWLVLAKRPETRNNRIETIATLAGMKQKPKQF